MTDWTLGGKRVFAYTAAHAVDPARPSVAFVHGAGVDHSVWGLQSRYFGYHGRNVLAVDLPGHGRSEGPPLASVEAIAEWLLGFLDAAGLARVALVGHSMGALAAIECAARRPGRVEALALVGTGFPMKVNDAYLEAARRNEQTAYDMYTIWGHAVRAALGANPNPGMCMHGDTLARLARLAPGVLYTDLKACNDYAAGPESAARVRCPALFVLGQGDQMTPPRTARGLVQAIPGARVLEIPESGHSVMTDAPDALLDALIGFFGPVQAVH